MIELFPITDTAETERLFLRYGLDFCEDSGCVKAVCGDETVGFSLYTLNNDGMTVFTVEPKEDLSLADGVLRSTLHVAAERSVMNTFYGSDEVERLCQRLDFIKDREEKRINIDKLFQSCCECK